MFNDADLIGKVKAQLTFREIPIPSDAIIQIEIDKAIGVINDRRRFTPTVNKPYDMKYQHLIVPLCVFALAKVGIEGETSHSENGVQRIYAGDSDYPQDILNGIVPLAK